MKYILNAGMAFVSLALAGCNTMYSPPTITENKIQVKESDVFQDVALYEINDAYLSNLADHHRRFGNTTMDVIVTYDPRSYKNTAMTASSKVADISSTLRKEGVRDLNASILPVKDQGDEGRLIVSYTSVHAKGPKNCGKLPGMNGSVLEDDPSYELGCSVNTLFAKQVSRPSDLAGRGQEDHTTEGRSAANLVDYVRSGARNEALDGESASGN